MTTNNPHLRIALEAAVPFAILDLYERGGLLADDIVRAQFLGHELASQGDALLYRSPTRGKTADVFEKLAAGVAMLAYAPGGVTAYGATFDAFDIIARWKGVEAAAATILRGYLSQVPQAVLSLARRGGPEEEDLLLTQVLAHRIATRGTRLLLRNHREPATWRLLTLLQNGLALLAHAPDGVWWGTIHLEAEAILTPAFGEAWTRHYLQDTRQRLSACSERLRTDAALRARLLYAAALPSPLFSDDTQER